MLGFHPHDLLLMTAIATVFVMAVYSVSATLLAILAATDRLAFGH